MLADTLRTVAHLFEDVFHVVGEDGWHGRAREMRQQQHVALHNGWLALPELRLLLFCQHATQLIPGSHLPLCRSTLPSECQQTAISPLYSQHVIQDLGRNPVHLLPQVLKVSPLPQERRLTIACPVSNVCNNCLIRQVWPAVQSLYCNPPQLHSHSKAHGSFRVSNSSDSLSAP